MSADLFAEFNNLSQKPPSQEPSPGGQPSQPQAQGWAQDPFGFGHSSSNPLPTPHPAQQRLPSQPQSSGFNTQARPPAVADQAAGDDDDGWGDFEVADSVPPPATMSARVSTIELMTSNLVDVGQPSPPGSGSGSSRPPARAKPRPRVEAAPGDPNVLFDADDFELQGGEEGEAGGDEFEDFEIAAQPTLQPQPCPVSSFNQPSMDLLSLDDPPPPPPSRQSPQRQPLDSPFGALSFGASSSNRTPAPKAPSLPGRTPFPCLSVKTSTDTGLVTKDKPGSPVTAWPSAAGGDGAQDAKDEDDDGWAEWDDVPGADAYSNKDIDGTRPPASWDWDAFDGSKPSAAESIDKDPPPMNVPPPSVILSVFPDLFNTGDSLLKAIAGQSSSVKQQVLSNPKAVQFLQGYILLGTTAARVLAGRKHRWHRDKMLAKSMSISAAGSKGMKLAGVDKTQSAREDREAADVVTAWREHVGRLRAAVATANTSGGESLKVPEVGDKIQIQAAKLVPTARTPCVICGLRREERIAKIDYDVEDSFGEWWVEHWGHRACKNFWVEHEQRLRQR